MGIASLIGWIAWPAIKWTMPSIGPKATLALIGVALAVVLIGAPAGAVWLHMHGVKREAVNVANAGCELRLSKNTAASAEAMADLLVSIKAAEDAAVEPKTKAEEIAACRKSKLCREHAQ